MSFEFSCSLHLILDEYFKRDLEGDAIMAEEVIEDAGAPEMPLECRSCVLGMAVRTAREAGLSEAEREDVVRQAVEWMSDSGRTSRSTLHLGRMIADKVVEISGLPRDFDIYREPKRMSNRLAQAHVDRLREAIASDDDPLAMAIRVAAAGNVIDFGAKDHAAMDIEGELRAVTAQRFERFDLERFRQRLMRANSLLYICDNAGEIVFDTLLM